MGLYGEAGNERGVGCSSGGDTGDGGGVEGRPPTGVNDGADNERGLGNSGAGIPGCVGGAGGRSSSAGPSAGGGATRSPTGTTISSRFPLALAAAAPSRNPSSQSSVAARPRASRCEFSNQRIGGSGRVAPQPPYSR